MSKWVLDYAIHRGTISSRDIGPKTQYETKEEAVQALHEKREFFHSIGYRIWYAKITSPNGKTETLETNPYNRY